MSGKGRCNGVRGARARATVGDGPPFEKKPRYCSVYEAYAAQMEAFSPTPEIGVSQPTPVPPDGMNASKLVLRVGGASQRQR